MIFLRPRTYSKREFVDILIKNGYYLKRKGKGDHLIYTNGEYIITITPKLNKMIALRLIKEHNLKVY